ncbi:MAG TPA: acyl-CoA carboxylase subunit epsilon [Candidatus Microbacterium pullistercoris]|nr:acyl-CoA carboxylase subunit epsilon [Candidatus Microbacterium pullistercoris]
MTDQPDLRVTRGNPTDEELAAVLAVVTEAAAQEAATATVDDRPANRAWTTSRRLRRYDRRPWGGFAG